MRSLSRRELVRQIAGELDSAGVSDAAKNAAWMACDLWECSRAGLVSNGASEASVSDRERLRAMSRRRLQGEPLQYILGTVDFCGLTLEVSPAALIPRPETEIVVQKALALLGDRDKPRVLDVGTGTGCIALALKNNRPDANVWACDVSATALELAESNAQCCGLEVSFMETDITEKKTAGSLPDMLDLLISNPPYVPDDEADSLAREVSAFEPAQALFTGADPMVFYRHLERLGRVLLAERGLLVLETHAGYAGEVASLLQEAGYDSVSCNKDLAGRPRVVAGRKRGLRRG